MTNWKLREGPLWSPAPGLASLSSKDSLGPLGPTHLGRRCLVPMSLREDKGFIGKGKLGWLSLSSSSTKWTGEGCGAERQQLKESNYPIYIWAKLIKHLSLSFFPPSLPPSVLLPLSSPSPLSYFLPPPLCPFVPFSILSLSGSLLALVLNSLIILIVSY